MKINRTEYLINSKKVSKHPDFKSLINEVNSAIELVRHPKGSKEFTIHPEKMGNGVKPLKDACMISLEKNSWQLEKRLDIATNIRPGPVDAYKESKNGIKMAVEWETGNISSSHRAVNKMCVGLINKQLDAGALILPSRKLYRWLTDRVGNYQELEPYFVMWELLEMHISDGCLLIIEIEHNNESPHVKKISKGTDGRALV